LLVAPEDTKVELKVINACTLRMDCW
jgi:hypothetical protein